MAKGDLQALRFLEGHSPKMDERDCIGDVGETEMIAARALQELKRSFGLCKDEVGAVVEDLLAVISQDRFSGRRQQMAVASQPQRIRIVESDDERSGIDKTRARPRGKGQKDAPHRFFTRRNAVP